MVPKIISSSASTAVMMHPHHHAHVHPSSSSAGHGHQHPHGAAAAAAAYDGEGRIDGNGEYSGYGPYYQEHRGVYGHQQGYGEKNGKLRFCAPSSFLLVCCLSRLGYFLWRGSERPTFFFFFFFFFFLEKAGLVVLRGCKKRHDGIYMQYPKQTKKPNLLRCKLVFPVHAFFLTLVFLCFHIYFANSAILIRLVVPLNAH
jgi:hypothetical protein